MQKMTFVEMHVKWSVILMDQLGPKILTVMGHCLALVVEIGVVTAEASQSEKLREWDGMFYVLWMKG